MKRKKIGKWGVDSFYFSIIIGGNLLQLIKRDIQVYTSSPYYYFRSFSTLRETFNFWRIRKKGRRIACSSSGIFWSKKIISILLFLSYFLDKIVAQLSFYKYSTVYFPSFFPTKSIKSPRFQHRESSKSATTQQSIKWSKQTGLGVVSGFPWVGVGWLVYLNFMTIVGGSIRISACHIHTHNTQHTKSVIIALFWECWVLYFVARMEKINLLQKRTTFLINCLAKTNKNQWKNWKKRKIGIFDHFWVVGKIEKRNEKAKAVARNDVFTHQKNGENVEEPSQSRQNTVKFSIWRCSWLQGG